MTSPLPPAIPRSFEQPLADQARSFREQTLRPLAQPPFFGIDTTVGVENDFQVAVEGKKDDVDLALTILDSNYYKNLDPTGRARRPLAYGKPLTQCGPLTARLFHRFAFVFTGATKKAVYEGKLVGVRLVPIQGLTCVLYTGTALIACHLFLQGHYRSAFLLSLVVSQVWRVLSETLRADFRGFSAISAYQKMGLAAIVYGIVLSLVLPQPALPPPDITRGLVLLFNPLLLLGLQALWLILFFVFGRSMVTGATLSFQVHHDRI